MTEKEAAGVLCYSQRALQNWRVRGGGPEYVKVNGNSVRYQLRPVSQPLFIGLPLLIASPIGRCFFIIGIHKAS